MFKKGLSMALAVLLCAVLLAACGGDGGGSGSPGGSSGGSGSQSSTAGGDESLEPITVTAVSRGMGDNIIDNVAKNAFFIELAKRTGITIEFTHPVMGNEIAEFELMLSSGKYEDIIWKQMDYKGGDDVAVDEGVYRDLTPYIEEYMPNYWALINSDPDLLREAYTDAGRIVGLLTVGYDEETGIIQPEPTYGGFGVRKDWLDEMGMDLPVTYDDWTEMLRGFRDNYGCDVPFYISSLGYWTRDHFTSGFGALNTMQMNGGTVEYGPITQGWRDYLTLMNQWYTEGLIGSEYVTNTPIGIDLGYMMAGRSGAMLMIYAFATAIEGGVEGGADVVAVSLPVRNKGEVAQGRAVGAKGWPNVYLSTNMKEEYIPRVLAMFDFMYTEEGARLAAYGVEGVTHTFNEDGTVEFTDLIMNNPDGITPKNALDVYASPPLLMAMKDFSRDRLPLTEDELEMMEVWNTTAGGALVVPPIRLSSAENTTYSAVMTDVQTYFDEMTSKFIMGLTSIESGWDSYVETIQGMGIDDAIAAYQSAYDRYMKG